MGSFTELTLAVTFAAETPPEALAAFAEFRAGEDAPELAPLDELPGGDGFEAEAHLGNYFGDDPAAGLTLWQRAATWRYLTGWGENAYFAGTPSTTLRWDAPGQHWTLTTRTLPKESGEWVQSLIASLGEWVTEGAPGRPRFVGYLADEHSSRPVLIWSVGRAPFRFEGSFEEE